MHGWQATSFRWNAGQLFALAFVGSIVSWLCLVFHRLFLHPLRNVPGPKLAAATSWYEFYQDVILDGHYLKDYPRLHAQYGPIVRMSPNRVHVDDVAFYHKVYSTRTRYLKEPAMFKFAGELDALAFVLDPAEHKIRRGVVNPLFTPRAVLDFSPTALQIIKAALEKVEEARESGLPVSLKKLESSLVIDVVVKLCFGKDMNCVREAERCNGLVESMTALSRRFSLVKHFPFLGNAVKSFPNRFMAHILPGFVEFRNQCAELVTEVRERHQKGIFADETGRQTVFDAMIAAEPQRPTDGFVDEAFALVFGGTDTTVTTMTVAIWCILKNPDIEKKLLDELNTVEMNSDGLMEYPGLINLPYLTTVSTAQRMIHHNPELFPEPDVFAPERWLGDGASANKANLVPFSRGPRMCLGMNLSYMEVYTFLGNLFRRYSMSLEKPDQAALGWSDQISLVLKDDVRIKVNGLR
ncbi:elymoclavine monooxygenase [Epichloe bromicola]|uniref:Elymoclavine monooxygenase n=1 Tax=Epichloe bromicola TaxID=79588 RepID=A0ABQ0CR83_9HYPO